MTYQQFDEKLQNIFVATPERLTKMRTRWASMSRRGPAFYIFTRGSLLFFWIMACFTFFAWRLDTLGLLHSAIILSTVALNMLFFSFFAPAMAYISLRDTVAKLDRSDSRRHRPDPFLSIVP